jgi:hypothetical protein
MSAQVHHHQPRIGVLCSWRLAWYGTQARQLLFSDSYSVLKAQLLHQINCALQWYTLTGRIDG